MSPQARETNTKLNTWDYIKAKNFCIAKETINKTKRKPTNWEKRFTNHISDKGLIINSSYNSISRKQPIKKWANGPNRHFSKEDIQMIKRLLSVFVLHPFFYNLT